MRKKTEIRELDRANPAGGKHLAATTESKLVFGPHVSEKRKLHIVRAARRREFIRSALSKETIETARDTIKGFHVLIRKYETEYNSIPGLTDELYDLANDFQDEFDGAYLTLSSNIAKNCGDRAIDDFINHLMFLSILHSYKKEVVIAFISRNAFMTLSSEIRKFENESNIVDDEKPDTPAKPQFLLGKDPAKLSSYRKKEDLPRPDLPRTAKENRPNYVQKNISFSPEADKALKLVASHLGVKETDLIRAVFRKAMRGELVDVEHELATPVPWPDWLPDEEPQ